ncbi:hypothetical protein [Alicyclobacillus tolerans]|uniref:Uncharacterized protein n=1 Tax=Alicyclobacillus tolerans TaxID=90970 RepID=A0A1M6TKX6_9BACL|nr:hypothetical protein [Alicyclobacillus montanus]SHK57539.1 hypothetical protein SAMN05443507_1172 [Alicyclobacillus montanus]
MVNDKDWDDHFPDGVYAVSPDPNSPRLMVRKLVDYCKEHGIPLSDIQRLPPEVMKQFLVYPTKDGTQDEKKPK